MVDVESAEHLCANEGNKHNCFRVMTEDLHLIASYVKSKCAVVQIAWLARPFSYYGRVEARGGWKGGHMTTFSGHIIDGRVAESFTNNVSRRETSLVIFCLKLHYIHH